MPYTPGEKVVIHAHRLKKPHPVRNPGRHPDNHIQAEIIHDMGEECWVEVTYKYRKAVPKSSLQSVEEPLRCGIE